MQNQFIGLLCLFGEVVWGRWTFVRPFSLPTAPSAGLWSITSDGIDPMQNGGLLQHCTQRDMIHKSVFHPGDSLSDIFFCKTAQLKEVIKNSIAKCNFVWLIISLTFFFLLNKVNNTCYHSKLNCISCQVSLFLKARYHCQEASKLGFGYIPQVWPEGIWPTQHFPREASAASTVTWRSLQSGVRYFQPWKCPHVN